MYSITHRCGGQKSEDGASGGPYITCDGVRWSSGKFTGGCDEPCRWRMGKPGEGHPPWGATSDIEKWLITIEAHCREISDPSWGSGPEYMKSLAECIKSNVASIRGELVD